MGEEQYYINGKLVALSNATTLNNGTLCMPMEAVMDFLEVSYTRENNFIFIGSDMYCPWDLGPMMVNSFDRTLREEILQRLQMYLMFDLPTSEEEILHAYEQNHADGSPFKLFIDDFEELKKKADRDPVLAELIADLLVGAEREYNDKIIEYERNGKRVRFASSMEAKAYYLAFAYKMTGEERYKDKLWENLEAASTFEDIMSTHALDMGYMSQALAVAYNWLYDDWTSEQRAVIEEMIVTKIFEPFMNAWTTPIYSAMTEKSYPSEASNQVIVINSGLLSSALVMLEKEPEICSELIRTLIKSCSVSIAGVYPDGSWAEGIAYWGLTMDYMPYLITNLQEHLGSDLGFTTCPGFAETFYFPFANEGGEGCFLLGDMTSYGNAEHPSMMWWAKESGDKELASLCVNAGLDSFIELIYYVDVRDYVSDKSALPCDYYYGKEETVFMRNAWGDSDTYLVFHGGNNDTPHGHIDNGTFQFDMIGERWACEVPKEDYGLVGYGQYGAVGGPLNPYKDGYYRNIAEGHNTVVADLANNRKGQKSDAVSPIVEYDFSDSISYAIMDLTDTNDLYSSALRGVKLNKITGEIVIQDEFKSTAATEFWWFMHTQADIVLSADRKTATLTLNKKSITASIISDGNEVFQILPAERLKGYGANAPQETSNEGYQKLAIQKKDSDVFNVAVSFRPVLTGNVNLHVEEEYLPLESWEVAETERAVLEKVYVDKAPFANFDPNTYNYEISTKTEKSSIPEIFVPIKGDYKVDVVEADTLPGITTIYLSKENEVVGQYNFIFTPLIYTSEMLNEKQIPIAGFTVTSEPEPANVAKNLFDLNLGTKYATQEIGGSLTIDFGETVELYEVKLGFLFGDQRKEFFKIFVSEDGENYTEVLDGTSSGTTTDYQSFIVGPVMTRYMKVFFYGNEKSDWVSISELIAFKQ